MWAMASFDLSKQFSASNSLTSWLTGNLICQNPFITLSRMYTQSLLSSNFLHSVPVSAWSNNPNLMISVTWNYINSQSTTMRTNLSFFCVHRDIHWNVWKLAILSLIDYLTLTCSYSNIILECHTNPYFTYSKIISIWNSTEDEFWFNS